MNRTRTPLGTHLWRGLRLRCPQCGGGKLFAGPFRMHERCTACGLKFERAPGYFLGSTYVNYAFTAVILTSIYVTLRFGYDIEKRILALPLFVFCIVFPLIFFRFARALWLSVDCYFDVTGFREDPN